MDDRTRGAKIEASDDMLLRDDGTGLREDRIMPPGTKAKPGSRLRPIFLLGVAVLLGLGIYRITGTLRAPRDSGRGQETAPQPVDVATIGTGDIKVVVTALGTVTPIATVTVKTQVNGQLLEVGFQEGQTVKKGDFLAQIDPRPFQLTEAQFEGQLVHDQGLLDQARKNLARFQTLLKQDSIARQQAEDQAFIVKQDEGLVKTDQAEIDMQKLNLIYAHIVSPIDGRVGLRLVDAGNYVQTTDSGLAVITQLHPISVIFVVPEDDIPSIEAAIRAGTALEVTAYDRANVTPLSVGKVATLDTQIDTTTGTVKLRADFDNLDDKLFPNQFVNARLLIKSLRGAVTVPSSAVQHGAPGTYVYVVGADDTVAARAVALGPLDGAMFAVNAGLSPGERVVVDGADRLRDGAKVLVSAAEGSNGGGTPPPADAAAPGKKRLPSQHPSEHGGQFGGPP
ncbi:MAG: efflux RND transporter periplasmic adaptor subunit [Pseudomonadota bacterium]|nr:efflux RND transporter periplasmic adaptor subunit [Pseudomonadota bacterium]